MLSAPRLSPSGWDRQLLEFLRVMLNIVLRRIDHRIRRPSSGRKTIVVSRKGAAPENNSRRLCIFCSYDRDSLIDDYVVHWLKSFNKLNFEIVFVTTSPKLSIEEEERIKPYVHKIILRKNVGLDFGSWKTVLETIDITKYTQLTLANDSVYGPFFDLAQVYKKMENSGLDMWGLTDSWDYSYHVQSYFMVFNQKLLHSRSFKEFWDRFVFYSHKDNIIRCYEVGLSQYLLRRRFKIGAACEYKEVRKKVLEKKNEKDVYGWSNSLCVSAFNPTNIFWKELISEHQCPILKIDLLRANTYHMPDLYQWPSLIKENTSYDHKMIESHLRRVTSNGIIA